MRVFADRAMYAPAVSTPKGVHLSMARLFHRNSPPWRRKYRAAVLAFCYLSGLLSGISIFRCAGGYPDSLMRSALSAPVSIVGLLCVNLLPFLFSAFAVFVSRPGLLYLVSFADALVYGFIALGVMRCFGSAGWLIRWLLCFSGSASAPVLYFYWLRNLRSDAFSTSKTAGIFSLLLLIGSVDFCLISPFLARLING